MSRDVELLTEIRDLLRVMAEPAIAQRDAKFRTALRDIVGTNTKKAQAVQLMDGSRSQSTIYKAVGMDQSHLSKLVKKLAAEKLLAAEQKEPRLLITVPPNFFDGDTK